MDGSTSSKDLVLMEESELVEQETQEPQKQDLVLRPNGDVGIYEPLGLPSNVTEERHGLISVQNDHKDIIECRERGLDVMQTEACSQEEVSSHRNNLEGNMAIGNSNGHTDGVIYGDLYFEAERTIMLSDAAFAKVNSVSPGSPADVAGLLEGDKLLAFGSINYCNFNNLSQIEDVLRDCGLGTVKLRVRREEEVVHLTLKPCGFLGCDIEPIIFPKKYTVSYPDSDHSDQ